MLTPFTRFATSRVVGWLGGATSLVALPVLVLDLGGGTRLTALLVALEALPYLCLGLWAGSWGDRAPRRRTMLAASLLSAAVVASVPLAASAGVLTVAQVIGAAVVVGVLAVFADAAAFGSLVSLVGREGVAAAQGRLMSAGTLVAVAGPGLGGLLVGLIGPAPVLWLEAAGWLIAAALLLGLPLGGGSEQARAAGVWESIREGVRFVVDHPLVRGLTLGGIGLSVAGGAVGALQVAIAVDVLRVPADGPLLGVMFAAGALGSAVAGLAFPRVQHRWAPGVVATWGYAAGWVLVLALVAASTLAVTVGSTAGWAAYTAGLAIWHLVTTTVIVNGIVARQVVTPADLQSRVNATARMVAWGGQPVGGLLAALLLGAVDPRLVLLLVGSALLGSFGYAVASGLPRLSAGALAEERVGA